MMLSLDGRIRERPPSTGLLWGVAFLIVLVGVLGLFHDSPPGQVLESWINVRALFGMLLWGLVIARFHLRLKRYAPMLPADIRTLSRQLSRMVYLLLYLVIGVGQLIDAAAYLWRGGASDFRLENFQAFLACGFVALLMIRLMAFRAGLRLNGTLGVPRSQST
jgi:cytochrome b561